MPRRGPDHGASSVEYAGLIVLAAALLTALFAAGTGKHLTDAVSTAVCRITAAGDDCGDGTRAQDGTRRTGTTGYDRRTGAADNASTWIVPPDKLPRAKKKRGDGQRHGTFGQWEPPKKEEWFEFRDRGDYTWDCGKVFDVACKIGGGFAQGTKDLWDGAATVGCLAHLCSHSGFKQNWSDVGHIFTQNPLTTGKQMWDGFEKPFVDNWRKGGPGKAMAYGLPAAFAGALKPFKLARDAREAAKRTPEIPHVPSGSARTDLRDAREAAESGDVSAADRAIAALTKKIAIARAKDRAAGCPVAAPALHPRRVVHAAVTYAALPADDGDCGAADRLAKELGVGGDEALDQVLKREKNRRNFFASRKGARVAKMLRELEKLKKESAELADSGDVRTAKRRAKAAELLANDIRGRAKREKDPERRRILSDAANSAEVAELAVKDNARTAGVVRDLDHLPYNKHDRIADKSPPVREVFRGHRLVIDYDGDGPPYVDNVHRTEDGRPVLHLDRSRITTEAELNAQVIYTTMMDHSGYFTIRDDGLRAVNYRNPEPSEHERHRYAVAVNEVQNRAYLPAVRELYEKKVDPDTVDDPVLREVYRVARANLERATPNLEKKQKLKGKDLIAGQDHVLRKGIERALHLPMDALGGRTPFDLAFDEYDAVTGYKGN